MIDLDSLIPGSAFFRWREAVFLHKWNLHGYPPPDIHKNIIWFAKNVADPIRNYFGKPVVTESWWRPPSYNEFIGGAKESGHLSAIAWDFRVLTIPPSEVQAFLKPRLEHLNIRMELDTITWTHVDSKKVLEGQSRTFKPNR